MQNFSQLLVHAVKITHNNINLVIKVRTSSRCKKCFEVNDKISCLLRDHSALYIIYKLSHVRAIIILKYCKKVNMVHC